MKFVHCEGQCVEISGARGEKLLRIRIYLESNSGIMLLRDVEVEPDPDASVNGEPDLHWEADQWTQETIVHWLLPAGWELVGAVDPPSQTSDQLPRSPRYALRHIGVPEKF